MLTDDKPIFATISWLAMTSLVFTDKDVFDSLTEHGITATDRQVYSCLIKSQIRGYCELDETWSSLGTSFWGASPPTVWRSLLWNDRSKDQEIGSES